MAQQTKSDAAQIVTLLEDNVDLVKQAASRARSKTPLSGDEGMFERLKEYRFSLADALDAQVKRIESKTEKKPGLDIPLVKELLTSSSLQAIGGGDISSVLSGTIQASMLTAMQETASNTGKIAAGTDPGKVAPSNVAK
jgi:hypothetical protein